MSNSFNNKLPVILTGAKVQVRGTDVNGALRRLKKILEADDRQKDLARHEFYEKPSVKRKRDKDQAKKRTKKERERNLASGDTPYKKPDDLKYLKGHRERRKIIDVEAARARAKRLTD